MRRVVLVLSLLVPMAACGGGGGTGDDSGTPDGPPQVDADNAGWSRLIGRTWTVPAGVFDIYRCTRIQVTEDIYVEGFRSQAPLGSHHAVLTQSTSATGPLGDYDCGVNTLDMNMLYASGVGTLDLTFPADVGVRIPAGTYLNLNLHLFNSGDGEINGDSAVLVKRLAGPPGTLANMTFAGPILFTIPSGATPYTQLGGCTINSGFTAINWWPHMHQLAVHQKLTVTRGGDPMVLLDRDYSFTEQRYYTENAPFTFMAGDEVEVACTYINDTGAPVQFGDSSTEEMCFTGWYRYPAAGNLFSCVSGF